MNDFDKKKRNDAIIKMMQEETQKIINDPVLLQEWVDRWKKREKEFEAYMALESHKGNCYCHRCMIEFSRTSNQDSK